MLPPVAPTMRPRINHSLDGLRLSLAGGQLEDKPVELGAVDGDGGAELDGHAHPYAKPSSG
jgi:hypothetical protein